MSANILATNSEKYSQNTVSKYFANTHFVGMGQCPIPTDTENIYFKKKQSSFHLLGFSLI